MDTPSRIKYCRRKGHSTWGVGLEPNAPAWAVNNKHRLTMALQLVLRVPSIENQLNAVTGMKHVVFTQGEVTSELDAGLTPFRISVLPTNGRGPMSERVASQEVIDKMDSLLPVSWWIDTFGDVVIDSPGPKDHADVVIFQV
jgi:hypothetical protein